MRNKTATALLGAGAFSLALAGMVPLVISPALLKAPGEIDLVTHSRSAAQVFDIPSGKLKPVEVELTRKLTAHVNEDGKIAGDADVAVYDEALSLAVVGSDGKPQMFDDKGDYVGLRADKSVVAFDRKTGLGVKDYKGDTWNTEGQTVKFPFGTEQKTYDLYDQSSKKAWPVEYTRTTTVKGLKVYEFKGTVKRTPIGQFGALVGTQTFYKNTGRTILVEPVTGSIVSSTTSPKSEFSQLLGNPVPVLDVEELMPTDATVAERVATAKDAKSKAQNLQRAPWALGLLGLFLFAGGLLGRLRRDDESDGSNRPDGTGVLPSPRSESPSLSKSKH